MIQLTGRGFTADNTSVSFRAAGRTAKATNVAVLNGGLVQLTTPPSPAESNAPVEVEVIATVNGVDSAPLAYRYIVPNRPVFQFTASCRIGNGEAMNSLLAEAFNADGSVAQETITLSADETVLEDASGHLVTSVNVPPGTNVSILGVGPISARVSALPGFVEKAKFQEGPPCKLP